MAANRVLRLACVALGLLVFRYHLEYQAFAGSVWVRAEGRSRTADGRPRNSLCAVTDSCLAQLAGVTTLSIDTGDLSIIKEYADTGFITDATTNPLFVSQAGMSGDPVYIAFVEDAIEYASARATGTDDIVALAMDKLAVNLGVAISKLIPGYISTEVDPRLSFDKEETLRRARRIIALYEEAGVPRERVLIKLAATWEGIAAMAELEKEGITCNMTLVFGFVQAVAAAQYGARLISPFPGRVLDFHKRSSGKDIWEPEEDPGVVAVERMYSYYKRHGHDTICMPASWRPSRGPGHDLDEIKALAGVDRMTIPPGFLKQLAEDDGTLERRLQPEQSAKSCADDELCGGRMSEVDFRLLLNDDACATEKTAEGLRAFISDTNKLEDAIRQKIQS